MELMKSKFAEFKKMGQTPSVKEVAIAAKKDWTEVKAGTHPLYIQGTASNKGSKKTKKHSSKKTKKQGRNRSRRRRRGGAMSELSPGETLGQEGQDRSVVGGGKCSLKHLLSKIKLCKSCTKKVRKTNSMKGGCGDTPCEAPPALVGGKRRRRKNMKAMRGGDMMAATAPAAESDTTAAATAAAAADTGMDA